MTIFHLPDLGEGLPDAEIHEWFVKEGDTVKQDQPLVSMETAKAVVDVPAPQDGVILKCHGQPGDVIKTGSPLVTFQSETSNRPDQGTVVGHLEQDQNIAADHFTIGSAANTYERIKATPGLRLLAKKLNVDLQVLQQQHAGRLLTREDIENEAQRLAQPLEGYEPLRGVRRAMLHSMQQSHQEVVPVSIFDEADIAHWPEKTDITVRLIRAIELACEKEPALNAWFDGTRSARRCFQAINLGLAMDNEDGLFVPVIPQTQQHSPEALRQIINTYKQEIQNRTMAPECFKNATITLSNFGKFAGRFASPIIVPPMVAILAVGRLYQNVVMEHQKPVSHRFLPLSLSFDHRAVTGGEATRFLGAVIDALQS